jgi:glycosyltransferase involved in cell wall biosynthesis
VRVVIPAYNAEDTIKPLLSSICNYIPAGQVIVVDDGSRDRTSSITRAAGAIALRHEANCGKGAALQTGLREAFKDESVQACIMLDADGQHEPNFIPDFLAALRNGQGDLIIGARHLHPRKMPLARVFSNRITSVLIAAKIGQRILDSQCGYRLISRKAFGSLEIESLGFEFESEMILKAGRQGLKISWVPISTIYGSEKSYIHGLRDTWRFIRTFFGA